MSAIGPFEGIGIIAPLVVVVIVATLLFQWLWNNTMTELFDLKSITLGQSFRLLLIGFLLFGHFG